MVPLEKPQVVARRILSPAAETDAAGNIKPSMKRSTDRIDGLVATIMALARALLDDRHGTSVYSTRGLFWIDRGGRR